MTTIIGVAGSLIIILLWIFILNQIVLFGAEIYMVYASTFGPHPKQHLSATVEKIVSPIEKAGEKIEQATRGKVIEAPEKKIEKAQAKEATEKPLKQMKGEETGVETKDSIENKEETGEPEKPDEGSVEVSVKIKTPEKKQKSEE